ncbi:hypothetical protein STEG23_004144 [Scotinomys teguina]
MARKAGQWEEEQEVLSTVHFFTGPFTSLELSSSYKHPVKERCCTYLGKLLKDLMKVELTASLIRLRIHMALVPLQQTVACVFFPLKVTIPQIHTAVFKGYGNFNVGLLLNTEDFYKERTLRRRIFNHDRIVRQENVKLERLYGILIVGIQDDGGDEGKGDDGDDHKDLEDDGGDNDRGDGEDKFELQFFFYSPHAINSVLNTYLALRQSTVGCESCDITIDDGCGLQWVVELRILLSKPLVCPGSYL